MATGEIHAIARRSVGVRDAVLGTSGDGSPLERGVREALVEVIKAGGDIVPDLIVAAGMLSAEVGLTSVPHVTAPAGLDDLARGAALRNLPTIAAQPIIFVPGVRTPPGPGLDGWATADVMRGEECETLGAWTLLARSGLHPAGSSSAPASAFLWPGSHTKLMEVDAGGRIVRSHTTLAGELTHALARHTLLAASLPEGLPDDPDPEAVAAGVRLVAREGLGRAAFLVRIAALTDSLPPAARAAFWLGAVVADDVAHLARHEILHSRPTVWVGGRHPLRELYTALLAERHPSPVRALDDSTAERASAAGAVAVARRFSQIGAETTSLQQGPNSLTEPAP
jgi:2-dehydro-3-deoxygalactonokinase